MTKIELFVSLKVIDNVALTAFNALKRMGYNKLKNLERSDYYKFDVKGNIDDFKNKISKVDILVNSNKNKFDFKLNKVKSKYKKINVIVEEIKHEQGLLSLLKDRLGFNNLNKVEKGVLWSMDFDKNTNKNIAVDITKSLLMNENYQKYKIL